MICLFRDWYFLIIFQNTTASNGLCLAVLVLKITPLGTVPSKWQILIPFATGFRILIDFWLSLKVFFYNTLFSKIIYFHQLNYLDAVTSYRLFHFTWTTFLKNIQQLYTYIGGLVHFCWKITYYNFKFLMDVTHFLYSLPV